ncbi:protein of unknown function [Limnospira indica PCC 8005]|uniref:Uncharacterized protein n=1 Tax=Limnospira indica PCC 8005 TaxID=376219 RepID=A0A9P1KCB0_9CYAN|nr:protein of unknown function [Limnospira indica PCC 8005]
MAIRLIFYSTPRRRLFAPTPLTNFWRSPIMIYFIHHGYTLDFLFNTVPSRNQTSPINPGVTLALSMVVGRVENYEFLLVKIICCPFLPRCAAVDLSFKFHRL